MLVEELPVQSNAVTQATGRHPRRSAGKAVAGLFSVVMLGATLAPVVENWKEQPQDSFPLSYYPMFSANRAEKYQVHYIVGLDQQGNRHLISYKFAGHGGFNQVRRQINKIVRDSRAEDQADGDKKAEVKPVRDKKTGGKAARDKKAGTKVVRDSKVDELCQAIAAKIARETSPPYSEIVTVQIVTGTYRFDDYFAGNTTPLAEKVRGKAKVKRGGP
jgi:hypothetical protein